MTPPRDHHRAVTRAVIHGVWSWNWVLPVASCGVVGGAWQLCSGGGEGNPLTWGIAPERECPSLGGLSGVFQSEAKPGVPLTGSPLGCSRVVVLLRFLVASRSKVQGQVLGQGPLTCVLSEPRDATCLQWLPVKAAYWISGYRAPRRGRGEALLYVLLWSGPCFHLRWTLRLAGCCWVGAAPQKCVLPSFCGADALSS